jgi:hypothetical protein
MEHLGGSLLRLAPVGPIVTWKAAQTVLGFPKQMPDGLLDVTFPDKPTPDPFLIEIESYPEQDTLEQIRRDVAMVLLTRGVLPDVLLLVLHPKGRLALGPEQVISSARGLTELRLRIHTVNLWEVPAEELLAAGDVGLMPWLPLAHFDGPPEIMLATCRQRIEQQARPEEKDNLLAMTHAMAEMRYNDLQLLLLLGATRMSLEKVLLSSPAAERLMAEREREAAERAALEKARTDLLRVLRARLGNIPEEVQAQLRALQDQQKLDELLDVAARCADLEAFRQALNVR